MPPKQKISTPIDKLDTCIAVYTYITSLKPGSKPGFALRQTPDLQKKLKAINMIKIESLIKDGRPTTAGAHVFRPMIKRNMLQKESRNHQKTFEIFLTDLASRLN